MNTNFKVIGLTRLGIKPKFTALEADALTTRPFAFTIAADFSYDKYMLGYDLYVKLRGRIRGMGGITPGGGAPIKGVPNILKVEKKTRSSRTCDWSQTIPIRIFGSENSHELF